MPETFEQQKAQERDVEAADVVAYLARHPDFFSDHPGLLAELDISHESGQAVSLIERQVAALREQNRRYRQQLRELMAIAEQNDELAERFRKLSLGFVACADLEGVLGLLETSLREDFSADAATLLLLGDPRQRLIERPDGVFMRILQESRADSARLPAALSRGESVCGRFNDAIMETLFADAAPLLESAAIVPVRSAEDSGDHSLALLAIGSRKTGHFTAGMGTVYLDYLGALLSHLFSRD